jgi:methyl-accepting chemotaxis protein
MSGIATGVGEIQQTVARLSDASGQIGEIVGQIEGIAAQTNLLALNATIEAARAGDAGRGFGVVASEVKALAEQTSHATDDIRARIDGVVKSIGEITRAMEASQSSVGNGRDVVDDVTTGLHTIAERVGSVTGQMSQLAAAITEQSAATDEIARSAAGVSRSSQSCHDEVTSAIEAVESVSENLNTQMAAFADLGDEALAHIAENDHMIFKRKILDVVIGRSSMRADAVTSHTACRLGKWAATVSSSVRERPVFKRLEAPHARVHELGRQVVDLANRDCLDEALARFDELEAASAEVIKLLKELAESIRNDGRSAA